MSIEIPGYKILRAIGRGGMATVYLAEQEIFEREVALKVMSKSLAEDPSFGQRFFREAKIVSQLVHPNIVTVHDVGEHDGHYYLSMEYIDGGDLKLARRRLTFRQKIRAIRDIATALQYASNKGYVHRDIKPENIMFHLSDGRAVLTDFGIARAAEAELSVTQTGVAIGTPHYMSPEQAKGQSVDGRADIYGLGVVLYLTLTGKVPFDAESAVAIGIKHITDPIPLLPIALNDLQPLLDKMMAKSPDQRFQNAASLISALDQLDMPVLEKKALDYDREQKLKEANTDVEDETPTLVSSPISPLVTAPSTPLPERTKPASVRTPTPPPKAKKPAKTKKPPLRQEPQLGSTTEINDAVPEQAERFTVIFENEELATQASGSSVIGYFLAFLVAGVLAAGAYFYLNQQEWNTLVQQIESYLYPQSDNIAQAKKPDQVAENTVAEDNKLNENVELKDSSQDVPGNPAEIITAEVEQLEANTAETDNGEVMLDTESTTTSSESLDTQSTGESEEQLRAQVVAEQSANIVRLQEAFAKDAAFLPDLVAAYRRMLELDPQHAASQQALITLEANEKAKIQEFIASRKYSAAQKKLEQLQSLFNETNVGEYQSLEKQIQAEEKKDTILNQADRYFSEGLMLQPEEGNALKLYKQVLALDEKNPRALQGVRKVSDFYLQQAGAAFADNDIELAEEKVKQALEVDWKNDKAEKLLEDIRNFQERKDKQDLLFLQAEQALNEGYYFEPLKANAYHFYAQILEQDPENARAFRGVVMVKEGFALWLQELIGRGEYASAESALVTPLNILPNDMELQELAKNIKEQIAERSVKHQPSIEKVLVSATNISDINASQAEVVRASRNIYVGFEYANLSSEANQMEARLLDGAGNIEVAKAAIALESGDGVAILMLESPVGSFPVGLYTLELNLQGRNLFSRVFAVE